MIEDDLNIEPENVDEKAKRFEPVSEPALKTPEEIEKTETDRLKDLFDGLEMVSEQEKNDGIIAEIFAEQEPILDRKIEDIFIDDDESFKDYDITEEDKDYIRSLIDKTNFVQDMDDDIDLKVKSDGNDGDDEVIIVKSVPAPLGEKPLHPSERLKQKVKKIRKRKERYKVLMKKKAISFLNKKRLKNC